MISMRKVSGFAGAALLCGLVLACGCGQKSAEESSGTPVQQAQKLVDDQIKKVQGSKYLTPEQKDEQIQRIRAMNAKLGQTSTSGH